MDEVREHYRAQFREQLATMLRSATKAQKVRRLQPLIERYLLDGANHQVVAEDLSVAGLEISRQVFTATLNRVRAESIEDAPKTPRATAAPAAQPKSPTRQQQKQTIDSPADLRAIRDMNFDLEALRQEELARRRAKKNS